MDLPRIAWVSLDGPDRNGGGGNIRESYILEALARRASVDLITSAPTTDDVIARLVADFVRLPAAQRYPEGHRVRRRLLDLWVALVAGPQEAWAARPALRAAKAEILARGPYDAVVIEHAGLAEVCPVGPHPGAYVLSLQNIASERARQQAAVTPGRRQAWVINQEVRFARRHERRSIERFDSIITVSGKDAGLLPGPSTVFHNGVDLARLSATDLPAGPHVVLTGTLGYVPNVDGAAWFVREVWPQVLAALPAATLTLVGRSPHECLLALDGRDSVRVLGDVPSIEPYLAEARVAVVPLRIGSGTRLKALDAMAAGRPVVGTTIGLEGLNVTNGAEACLEDEPSAFAAAVIRLLVDDAFAKALVIQARIFVEREHDWAAIGDGFTEHVLSLARSARS